MAELSARDADDDPDDRVTAAEWKAAHDAAVAEDEQHREITEDDVRDTSTLDHHAHTDQSATDWRDLREVADEAPAPTKEDDVRVPAAGETEESVRYAGRVLDEITYRDDTDGDPDERAQQLARWHDADLAAAHEHDTERDSEPMT